MRSDFFVHEQIFWQARTTSTTLLLTYTLKHLCVRVLKHLIASRHQETLRCKAHFSASDCKMGDSDSVANKDVEFLLKRPANANMRDLKLTMEITSSLADVKARLHREYEDHPNPAHVTVRLFF